MSNQDHGKDESSASLDICTEHLLCDHATPNWTKDFPVVGEGTLIFSIQRSTAFSIVIRPKLKKGEPGADQWISLEVHQKRAIFKISIDEIITTLKEVSGVVKGQPVGYEEGRKISYWFSYNRDRLELKYGKGYQMEETTLMTHSFLTGKKEKEHEIRKHLQYLFSPTIRRRVEQYDIENRAALIQQYAMLIRNVGYCGCTLQEEFPKLSSEALEKKSEELSKTIVDIEHKVAFDKDPFVCNWSPVVLDSSQVNLFEMDDNQYTFSASLPPACLKLYSNVTGANVNLDWSPKPTKYRLSDAIRYSLKGPNGTLYKKLLSKSGEFSGFEQTYLRITLGCDRSSSPGVPYVLEIWPSGHGSPIHNHGNAYAVIQVLHGGLTIKIFNKQADTPHAVPLQEFDVKKGNTTWLSPNWFQTHQLWNYTDDYCATVQCYQYGSTDSTHWPYFDYVADTEVIDEFLPEGDYAFHEMQKIVMKEFEAFMDAVPN